MIVRRHRSKNFTILENEVVEDERLALDEIGLLTWLRSRPDHWEVSRAHIGKRFKIGRDKVARIFRSLIECGWMVREITPPGVPARYVVCDEPGAEVELSDDQLAEIDGSKKGENDSPNDVVADLSQSGFPSTEKSSAGDPSTENPTAIVRTDLKQELKPPQPPQGGALDENFEKDWQEFKSNYPDGMVDPEAAKRELAQCSPADRKTCNSALPVYSDRLRKRREKSIKAHLFVRKRSWEGILASPGESIDAPRQIERASRAGKALATLGMIARYRPLTGSDGRLSYRGELTDRLLAMAEAPPEGAVTEDNPPMKIWRSYKRGTANFGAWWEFIRAVFAGCNLPALTEILVPWPWPPKVDGSIYSEDSTGPPPLVPGTLATQDDLNEMAKG